MGKINQGIEFHNQGNVSITGPMATGDHARAVQWQSGPERQARRQEKPITRVLLLCANSFDTGRLQLDMEERAIKESIKRGKERELIKLTVCPAATLHDLRRALLETPYDILHVAAHGKTGELVLADEEGKKQSVAAEKLAAYLQTYRQTLQCAIFNVCHSEPLARRVSQNIPYAIAVEGKINDRVALEFARGFYDALGAGKSIERAYTEGVHTAHLVVPDASARPGIFCKGQRISVK